MCLRENPMGFASARLYISRLASCCCSLLMFLLFGACACSSCCHDAAAGYAAHVGKLLCDRRVACLDGSDLAVAVLVSRVEGVEQRDAGGGQHSEWPPSLFVEAPVVAEVHEDLHGRGPGEGDGTARVREALVGAAAGGVQQRPAPLGLLGNLLALLEAGVEAPLRHEPTKHAEDEAAVVEARRDPLLERPGGVRRRVVVQRDGEQPVRERRVSGGGEQALDGGAAERRVRPKGREGLFLGCPALREGFHVSDEEDEEDEERRSG